MTDNEKAIRKANAQFGEEFLSSKNRNGSQSEKIIELTETTQFLI